MSVKKGTPVAGVVPVEAAIEPMLSAQEWRDKASTLEDEGENEKAVEAYRKAIALEPNDKNARFALAQMLIFDVEDSAAALALLETTPMAAWSSDLLYLRGRALAELQRQTEGIEFYKRALEIFKPEEGANNSRAEIHCSWSLDLRDAGRIPEALPIAERAVASDPNYAHAWECLGYFEHLAKDTDTALQCLALAVALEPGIADTFRDDPDYGEFAKDPRFQAMLKTSELTRGARELVPTLWPKGASAHDALPVFLAAVKRFVKPAS